MTLDRMVFRIGCTVSAVLLFNQAVFAGQFLGGSFGALHTHRENATIAGIAVLVTAASGLVVRLRGGPGWPALACLGLFGLIGLQILLGFQRRLTVHIPLGVAIIILMVLVTVWSWRSPGSQREPSEPSEPSEPAEPGEPSSRSDPHGAAVRR
jgi:hypothetical protein